MSKPRLAIYGAIAANVGIAITKFIVAGTTGSSAMLSEGIHSAVDTFNGVLLLVGVERSQRAATAEHPFGHGKEVYFWSLIVAVLIFGVGGGMSVYEGWQHIRHPEAMGDPLWSYVVLGVAGVFEGASFALALREMSRQAGDIPFREALRRSKDPTTFTVLAEDSAALAGLAIAAAGIALSHRLDMPELDGAASLLIGLLLSGVAIALIRESHGLLIGEGIRPETADTIRRMALEQNKVRDVGRILSMYIGPDDVLVTMDLDFDDGTTAAEAGEAIATVERLVRERYPMIRRLFIEAGTAAAHQRWSRPDSVQAHAPEPQRRLNLPPRSASHREHRVAAARQTGRMRALYSSMRTSARSAGCRRDNRSRSGAPTRSGCRARAGGSDIRRDRRSGIHRANRRRCRRSNTRAPRAATTRDR
jgi:cation diffusion facilitator family transporter